MREKYFRKMNYGAHGDGPAVTRKKRLQVDSSEQDDQRFRIHLVRPRAVAHMWGRGARILTEISRIPHSIPAPPKQNQGETQDLEMPLSDWTAGNASLPAQSLRH